MCTYSAGTFAIASQHPKAGLPILQPCTHQGPLTPIGGPSLLGMTSRPPPCFALRRTRPALRSFSVGGLVWLFLRGDGQPPSNCPLSRRVLGMVLQRKRFGGLGNDFASASAASIDAGVVGCFAGLVLLVELRTDADFYVIAAPKERHAITLLRPQAATVPWPKVGGALWPASGAGLEEG